MSTPNQAVAAALLFCLGATVVAADVTAGSNAGAFAALCGIIGLAETPITLPTQPEDPTASYKKLRKLNMTLAPQEWRTSFNKKGDNDQWEAADKPSKMPSEEWTELWPQWLEDAQQLTAPKARQAVLEEEQLTGLTEGELKHLTPKVATATNAVRILIAKYNELKADLAAVTADSAKADLNLIVYGNAKPTGRAVVIGEAFGSSAGTWQAVCEGNAAQHNAKTLAAVAYCLCCKNSNSVDGTDKVCSPQQTGASDWNPSQAPGTTQWAEIRKLCALRPLKVLTAATLSARIAAITNHMSTDGTSTYLGHFIKTGCTGSKSNGQCVKYTDIAEGDTTKLATIPWLQKLDTLHDKLLKQEAANAAARRIDLVISSITNNIKGLANEARIQTLHATTNSKKSTDSAKQTQQVSSAECQNITEKSKCKDNCE
uniref:Variant surface glycoprotein 1341 n=1 Tax=Trypanosoma brucei TaxID=5691 RepID=M4SW70_9TRYP|nr:variant surface glycoprotein 1341 [Trypanosoma brucei]